MKRLGEYDSLAFLPELHWLFLPPICDDNVILRVVRFIVTTFNCSNHYRNGNTFNRRTFRSYMDKVMRDSRVIRHAMIVG